MLDRVRRAYRALNQKALADTHPEVIYREHLTAGAVSDATTAAIENYVGYATLYKSYVWVHKAVSIIANAIAPHPLQVVDSAGQVLADHPIALLLGNPGSVDPAQLRAVMMVHKLLGGEWFLEEVPDKLGRPRELWTRRPDSVTVYPDLTRPFYPTVLAYEVFGMAQRIPATSMIHDRFVNPLSEWRGLAPTGAALAGIKLDIFNQASSIAFAQGGARPDYAVTTTEALTPDERERLEIQIATKYGSPEGRSRPMVLESGQGVQVLSFPPKDTEGLAQREMARDEVAAIFGVPDILMGFGNDSYDTEEKRKGAEGALWTLTLSPLIFRRDTVLTWHYRKRGLLKPDESVTTDLSSVAVLQEDILPKLDAAKRFFDMGVPYNTVEARLRLGTGPIPSGDVGYLPMALVPVDTASMTPAAAAPVQLAQRRSVSARRPGVVTRLEKAAGHDGVIAALWVPEVQAHQLALQTELLGLEVQPEAADDLHITLAYLGKLPDLDAAARVAIDETLASVARRMPPIDGVVNGMIRFTTDQGDGTHALCVAFDAPALGRWRHAIVEALTARGLPVVENHGFTPHITVAYIPADADTPTLALDQVDPIRIEALTLAAGPQRREYPLRLESAMASALRDVTKATAQQTSQALRRIKLSMARRMERDVADALDDLARRVVGRAKGAHAVVQKAGLPDLDDLLAADDLDPLQRLIERYALEICRASWETWNTSLAATIGFDEADPAVVAAIRQGGARITNIENTTRDAIRSALAYATEQSLSLSQFVNGADDYAGLASIVEESYANRARTIARTELAYAQNTATFTRYQGAGVDRVTVLDNGVEDSDPVCTELNGTVQTLAWAKANPLQHPNCLRTFAPYFD